MFVRLCANARTAECIKYLFCLKYLFRVAFVMCMQYLCLCANKKRTFRIPPNLSVVCVCVRVCACVCVGGGVGVWTGRWGLTLSGRLLLSGPVLWRHLLAVHRLGLTQRANCEPPFGETARVRRRARESERERERASESERERE